MILAESCHHGEGAVATLPYSLPPTTAALHGTSNVNGPVDEVWTATAPDWPHEDRDGVAADCLRVRGWLGWSVGIDSRYLVLRPQDSAPRGVVAGLAVAGGWLILGTRLDDQGLRPSSSWCGSRTCRDRASSSSAIEGARLDPPWLTRTPDGRRPLPYGGRAPPEPAGDLGRDRTSVSGVVPRPRSPAREPPAAGLEATSLARAGSSADELPRNHISRRRAAGSAGA